jgi:hypothetical protein
MPGFIHGDEIGPQPVNNGSRPTRLASLGRESNICFCWQKRECCLNPALPGPITSSILSIIYIKGVKRVASELANLL